MARHIIFAHFVSGTAFARTDRFHGGLFATYQWRDSRLLADPEWPLFRKLNRGLGSELLIVREVNSIHPAIIRSTHAAEIVAFYRHAVSVLADSNQSELYLALDFVDREGAWNF